MHLSICEEDIRNYYHIHQQMCVINMNSIIAEKKEKKVYL